MSSWWCKCRKKVFKGFLYFFLLALLLLVSEDMLPAGPVLGFVGVPQGPCLCSISLATPLSVLRLPYLQARHRSVQAVARSEWGGEVPRGGAGGGGAVWVLEEEQGTVGRIGVQEPAGVVEQDGGTGRVGAVLPRSAGMVFASRANQCTGDSEIDRDVWSAGVLHSEHGWACDQSLSLLVCLWWPDNKSPNKPPGICPKNEHVTNLPPTPERNKKPFTCVA